MAQAHAVAVLAGRREDVAVRDDDAVFPQHGIERVRVERFRQFDPQGEAALRMADARPRGEVAPHPFGHDVALALVLASHPAQVRRIVPLSKELGDGDLWQGSCRARTGVFHAQHLVEIPPRCDPAHPQPGRQGLGKRAAQQDPAVLVERLQGVGTGPAVDQVAVDVVLDDGNVEALRQPEQAQLAMVGHGVAERIAGIGNHQDGLDGPAFQREFEGFQADPLDGVRGNLECLHARFLQDLHRAVIAGGGDGHDVARPAQGPYCARQRFLATGRDDQRVWPGLVARVHGQPGQLLAQGGNPLHVVVVQAGDPGVPSLPGERRLQRAQAGTLDIRHAPAQLNRFPFAFKLQQVLDLPPIRHVDRPQRGFAHAGQPGLRAGHRHVPAGTGPRLRQAGHFKPAVGLLDGRQADAVLGAQGSHGGQAAAGRVQALFDTAAEGIGEIQIAAHRSCGPCHGIPKDRPSL